METVQLTSGIGSFKGPSSKKVRVSCIEASRVGFSSTKKKCFLRLVTKAATVAAPKPLVDRVLPKIRTAEENTCEILLPSTTKTKSQGSELVTSGEGMTLGKSKIDINDKAGFKVVYFKHAGTEVNFNGSRHLILEEDDIVAIIETEDIKDLKPLNNNVLIKVTEAKSKAASEATYEIQQDDTEYLVDEKLGYTNAERL
ncbi:hypothetical protein GIB67_006649 [Kingdonia uniflora]|uniref:Uncharacterized protein n=1 Tax=Kingdonia uniflora TaxID=39325 RepID=A0A7J7LTA5_9MAGN|nr:hypothetical protein GIB67_006649 [Kingdonia uniflora]